MKVKELIERLSNLELDTEVVVDANESGYYTVENVEMFEENVVDGIVGNDKQLVSIVSSNEL